MAGFGLLFILVVLQVVISFCGARKFAERGPGVAVVAPLALPAVVLILAVGVMLASGGFSEEVARATMLFAVILLVLLVIGAIAAAIAIWTRG